MNVEKRGTVLVDEIDFVTIFALEKELQAFLRHLGEYQTENRHDITFYRAEVFLSDQESYKLIVLGLPQMGNYEAATATTRAIDVWNHRFVLLGGIAGGLEQPGVNLGDVIVALQRGATRLVNSSRRGSLSA
jgi:nucleoside phosphorylase